MTTCSGAPSRPRRAVLAATLTLLVLAGPLAAWPALASAASAAQGQVFVIHGLAGVTADVLVDGQSQQAGAQAGAIVGPINLPAGAHTVSLVPQGGEPLSAQVEVAAGASMDVVAHSRANPAEPPVVTVFPNDLSPVGAGKSRLVVAHTAAVPPADVRVDGVVLFSNVANAESLELLVPAGTYSVDIVPAGTTGPVVFGPVDLAVAAGNLTRVFAFGDPTRQTMDAVVHTLPVQQEGAAAPMAVPAGDGGQAARREVGASTTTWAGALVALLAATAAAGHLLRRRIPASA